MNDEGGENVKAEKCIECGGWAEPPFKSIVCWLVPATVADLVQDVQSEELEDTINAVLTTELSLARFKQTEEVKFVRIERPLCLFCAYARSHGADGLIDEGQKDLGLSDED